MQLAYFKNKSIIGREKVPWINIQVGTARVIYAFIFISLIHILKNSVENEFSSNICKNIFYEYDYKQTDCSMSH